MPDPKVPALKGNIDAAKEEFGDKGAGSPMETCAFAEAEKKRIELLDRIKSGKSNLKVEGEEPFKKQTYACLDMLSRTTTGIKLVEALDSSSKKTKIMESTAANEEKAASFEAGLFDQKAKKPGPGTDTEVLFNPERKKLNGEDWMTRDPAIGLGHELIHSYHDVNGTTDGRRVVEYTDATGAKRKAPGYELQAVGLGEHASNDLTENKLRKDFTEKKLGERGGEVPRPRY